MKTFLYSLALLFASTSIAGSEEYCTTLAQLAKLAKEARDTEVPAAEFRELLRGIEARRTREMVNKVVTHVYYNDTYRRPQEVARDVYVDCRSGRYD